MEACTEIFTLAAQIEWNKQNKQTEIDKPRGETLLSTTLICFFCFA